MMYDVPWSQIGQLQQEVDRVKSELGRKAENYEIHTLIGRVDSMEHALWDIRSILDGHLSRLQACEDKLASMESEG